MKKYIIYKLAALGLIIGTFIACEYSQDVEPIVSPDDYPKLTFAPVEAYSALNEGDTIYMNVTSDKMIDRALTFDVHIVGGDGDDHDILVTPGVIAPYSNTAQVMVIFPQDWDAEPTESMSLEFGVYSTGERYLPHQTTEYPVLDLTVANYVSDVLTVSIGWDEEFTISEIISGETELPNGEVIEWVDTVEVEYDAADVMDIDVLISPAEDFDPTDPWSSDMGNYSAATGNNPEVFEAILEDGEYILWIDLWSHALFDPTEHEIYSFEDSTALVSLSATFERQGTPLHAVVAPDDSQVPGVINPGVATADIPKVGFNGVIAKLVVEGGVYTIVDYEDDTEYGVAKKLAKAKTPRPTFIKK